MPQRFAFFRKFTGRYLYCILFCGRKENFAFVFPEFSARKEKSGKRKETPHKQRKDLHFSANLRAVIFIVFYFAEKCKIFH